ncbi:MAG: TlpA disulfide reductase family protein [Chloroflexota bacterium]
MRDCPTLFRAIMLCLTALLLALPLISACRSGPASGPSITTEAKGELAIDFTLPTIAGDTVTLSELRGKTVLLNFWTTWCPACREEMPLLQAAYAEKESSGLIVLAVNIKESRAVVEKFIKDNGYTFPVVLDQSGKVAEQYNVYYLPHTVIIDGEGIVRRTKVGAFSSKKEVLRTVESFLTP